MNEQRKTDVLTLKGLASFFEELATGAEPYPLLASQAITRAIESLEMEIQMEEDGGELDLNSDVINASWARFNGITEG